MNVTIKGVKENLYRIFKAEAIKKGITLREAINEAMEKWVKEEKLEMVKNKTDMQEAIKHMDANRQTNKDIDTLSIIRKWRKTR
ncbi:MAG: hypothetical protein HWN65_15415 [Candidatus Helarchaeota archaeon]|nr:hypothetical protein [Candidatus Helarchaeota archaeon]